MTYFGELYVGVTEGDWHPAVMATNMGHETWEWVKDGDFEIMQSTGLKDKNGVEIYEGDILNKVFTMYDGESKYSDKLIVKFDEFFSAFRAVSLFNQENYFFGFIDNDFRVIGNNHQNPELLEKVMIND